MALRATNETRARANEAKSRALRSFPIDRSPAAPGQESVGGLPSGVVGIGYGSRRDGDGDAEPVVKLYVKNEEAAERLRETASDVPLEILPIGEIVPFHFCGDSCAHELVGAGTLGCIVRRANSTSGERFALSNNHVIANLSGQHDSAVLMPSRDDGGIAPDNRIAGLHQSVDINLDGSTNNRVDAGIALLDSPDSVSTRIREIGSFHPEPLEAEQYQDVMKYGRSTDYTEGIIDDVAADIFVPFGTRVAKFNNQISVFGPVERFGQPGDSGSLVLEMQTRRPVGLMFAGVGTTSFLNPIDWVLAELGVEIVAESEIGVG